MPRFLRSKGLRVAVIIDFVQLNEIKKTIKFSISPTNHSFPSFLISVCRFQQAIICYLTSVFGNQKCLPKYLYIWNSNRHIL